MDFVKMLLGLAASHLGGLALCALYAGTWRKFINRAIKQVHVSISNPLFSFVTFYLSLWHSVGRRDFSLNGRPGRDEEVKQYLWKRFGIAFSQKGFQHHPFFCHIMWTSSPPLKRSSNTYGSVVGIAFSQIGFQDHPFQAEGCILWHFFPRWIYFFDMGSNIILRGYSDGNHH